MLPIPLPRPLLDRCGVVNARLPKLPLDRCAFVPAHRRPALPVNRLSLPSRDRAARLQ